MRCWVGQILQIREGLRFGTCIFYSFWYLNFYCTATNNRIENQQQTDDIERKYISRKRGFILNVSMRLQFFLYLSLKICPPIFLTLYPRQRILLRETVSFLWPTGWGKNGAFTDKKARASFNDPLDDLITFFKKGAKVSDTHIACLQATRSLDSQAFGGLAKWVGTVQ